jgi:hypothetical protein
MLRFHRLLHVPSRAPFVGATLLLFGCFAERSKWSPAWEGFEAQHQETLYVGHALTAGAPIVDKDGSAYVTVAPEARCKEAKYGQRMRVDHRAKTPGQVIALNATIAGTIIGAGTAIYGATQTDVELAIIGGSVWAVALPLPLIFDGAKARVRVQPQLTRRVPIQDMSTWATDKSSPCADEIAVPTLSPRAGLVVGLPDAAAKLGGAVPVSWEAPGTVKLSGEGMRPLKSWTHECALEEEVTLWIGLGGLPAGIDRSSTPPDLTWVNEHRGSPSAAQSGAATVKLNFGPPTRGELVGDGPLMDAADRAAYGARAAIARADRAEQERQALAAEKAQREQLQAEQEAEERRAQQVAQLQWEAEQREAAERAELRRQANVNALITGLQTFTEEVGEVARTNDEKLRQLQDDARAQQASKQAAQDRAAIERA